MKRSVCALVALAALLTAGCAGATPTGNQTGNNMRLHSQYYEVTLPNGKKLPCIYTTRNANDGGPSCDWNSAR